MERGKAGAPHLVRGHAAARVVARLEFPIGRGSAPEALPGRAISGAGRRVCRLAPQLRGGQAVRAGPSQECGDSRPGTQGYLFGCFFKNRLSRTLPSPRPPNRYQVMAAPKRPAARAIPTAPSTGMFPYIHGLGAKEMNAPTMKPHAHSPMKAITAALRRFSFSFSNWSARTVTVNLPDSMSSR